MSCPSVSESHAPGGLSSCLAARTRPQVCSVCSLRDCPSAFTLCWCRCHLRSFQAELDGPWLLLRPKEKLHMWGWESLSFGGLHGG